MCYPKKVKSDQQSIHSIENDPSSKTLHSGLGFTVLVSHSTHWQIWAMTPFFGKSFGHHGFETQYIPQVNSANSCSAHMSRNKQTSATIKQIKNAIKVPRNSDNIDGPRCTVALALEINGKKQTIKCSNTYQNLSMYIFRLQPFIDILANYTCNINYFDNSRYCWVE